MPRTLLKLRIFPSKNKYKIKPELSITKSNFPQTIKHLNKNYYQEMDFLYLKELCEV